MTQNHKTRKTPTIYTLRPKTGYAEFTLDRSWLEHWTGLLSAGEAWHGEVKPITVELRPSARRGRWVGDLLYGMHLELLCSARAVRLLEMESIEGMRLFPVELMPPPEEYGINVCTEGERAEWFLPHIECKQDILDTRRTVCSGEILGATASLLKYEFRADVTPPPLFVANHDGAMLASKEFFDALKRHDLTGVSGRVLWDQRKGGRWLQPEHVLEQQFPKRSPLSDALRQASSQDDDEIAELKQRMFDAESPLELFAEEIGNNAAEGSIWGSKKDEPVPTDEELKDLREGARPFKPLKVPAPGFKLKRCRQIQFSQDGKSLWTLNERTVTRWDLSTGKPDLSTRLPLANTYFVAGPDDRVLLAKDTSGNLALVAAVDGEVIWRYKPKIYGGDGCLPALSPDGSIICDGDWHGRLRFLRAADGELLHEESLGADCMIRAVNMAADGRIGVVVDGRRRLIFQWRWPLGSEPMRTIEHAWSSDLRGAIEPDGRFALVWSDMATSQYKREKGKFSLLQRICLDTGAVAAQAEHWISDQAVYPKFVPDGDLAVVSLEKGVSGVFKLDSLELVRKIYWTEGHQADISPDAEWVAVSGYDVGHGLVIPLREAGMLEEHGRARVKRERGNFRLYTRTNHLRHAHVPRLIVYRSPFGWLLQGERRVRDENMRFGGYQPDPGMRELAAATSVDELGRELVALAREVSMQAPVGAREGVEVRELFSGAWPPPVPDVESAMCITFADDLIELWPCKADKQGLLRHSEHPCFPWPANLAAADLGAAVFEFLGRKSVG